LYESGAQKKILKIFPLSWLTEHLQQQNSNLQQSNKLAFSQFQNEVIPKEE
jgi:hypothetical protein